MYCYLGGDLFLLGHGMTYPFNVLLCSMFWTRHAESLRI